MSTTSGSLRVSCWQNDTTLTHDIYSVDLLAQHFLTIKFNIIPHFSLLISVILAMSAEDKALFLGLLFLVVSIHRSKKDKIV